MRSSAGASSRIQSSNQYLRGTDAVPALFGNTVQTFSFSFLQLRGFDIEPKEAGNSLREYDVTFAPT